MILNYTLGIFDRISRCYRIYIKLCTLPIHAQHVSRYD